MPGQMGKNSVHLKNVPDEKALKNLFDELSAGGKSVDPGTYKGVVYELPDGTRIRMRDYSKSGGSALDISLTDGQIVKVHIGGSTQ